MDMTAVPIPPHELKCRTWYYGARCQCMRLLALCEDLAGGKTEDEHLPLASLLAVPCECGRVVQAERLEKFRTA